MVIGGRVMPSSPWTRAAWGSSSSGWSTMSRRRRRRSSPASCPTSSPSICDPAANPERRPLAEASPIGSRHYVSELLGTFVLVALGPGAAMVSGKTHAFGHSGVALAFGLAVTLVIVATGHLGGAHINPAVTIGLWSVRQFPGRQVLPYVAAQCLGAVLASATLLWILGPEGGVGATTPAVATSRAFAVEAGFSAILAFVILGATDSKNAPGVAPFAIGATVFAGALVTGPLTGGSFNPARSLGPAVVGDVWAAHWLYWLAPTLGMIAAMHVYRRLRGSPADPI